jgi:prefoldin beta subunit
MKAPKELQESLQRLQLLEQNVQALALQKQQFQTQIFEIESALKELETAPTAYKIIGGIMVSSTPETLKKELNQKKELLELRLQNIEKQEKQIRERAKKLQEDLLASMKKESK